MNIQRDEIWITRGGEEVWIICINATGDRPVVGQYTKSNLILSWNKNGQWDFNNGGSKDLIHKKPVIKQIKLEAWISPSGRLELIQEGFARNTHDWTRVPNLDLIGEPLK